MALPMMLLTGSLNWRKSKMATTWLKYESASVKLIHWQEQMVTITNLFAKERRKGHATELMKMVCNIADDKGYIMQLVPGQYGHPIGPGNDVLIKFYESFGFVLPKTKQKGVPMIMIRTPSQEKQPL